VRTILEDRHLSRFTSLDAAQTARVWACVHAAWPEDVGPAPEEVRDPALLFQLCRGAGLDHARVVLALAREHDAVGTAAIAALVGRPIAPWVPPAPAVPAPAPQPAQPTAGGPYAADSRRVLAVAPSNPHRPGTDAHADYLRWRVGHTLAQHVAAGMPRRALRRALRNGWIVVE
jgi:hypothetical protein